MGSWNETCAISRLPILHGDPVVGILLADMRQAARFNPASSWAPVGLPVNGQYNDYGGIEEIVWSNLDKDFWSNPKGPFKDLVTLAQGSNEYHDCAVSLPLIGEKGWEILEEASREGRLLVELDHYERGISGLDGTSDDAHGGSSRVKTKVVLAMIHRGVWDALLHAAPSDVGLGDTQDRLKAQRNIQMAQIQLDNDEGEELTDEVQIKKMLRRLRRGDDDYNHPLRSVMSDEDGRRAGEISTRILAQYHDNMIAAANIVDLEEFELRAAELVTAHHAMRHLRRYWQPSGITSQETDVKEHIKFQQDILNFSKGLYDQWDFEDEDEDEDVSQVVIEVAPPIAAKPTARMKP